MMMRIMVIEINKGKGLAVNNRKTEKEKRAQDQQVLFITSPTSNLEYWCSLFFSIPASYSPSTSNFSSPSFQHVNRDFGPNPTP